MKKFWAVVAIVAVIAGLYLVFRSKSPPPQVPGEPNAVVSENNSNLPTTHTNVPGAPRPSPTSTVVTPSPSPDLASHAASPTPTPAEVESAKEGANLPPLTVLDHARVVMHNYSTAFGENPVGTNPEITAALMGKNPKQINFVAADSGLRVNAKGEMVDGYGTPFFFHQISGKEMEIRSAGPDRVMWTFDDSVTR